MSEIMARFHGGPHDGLEMVLDRAGSEHYFAIVRCASFDPEELARPVTAACDVYRLATRTHGHADYEFAGQRP